MRSSSSSTPSPSRSLGSALASKIQRRRKTRQATRPGARSAATRQVGPASAGASWGQWRRRGLPRSPRSLLQSSLPGPRPGIRSGNRRPHRDRVPRRARSICAADVADCIALRVSPWTSLFSAMTEEARDAADARARDWRPARAIPRPAEELPAFARPSRSAAVERSFCRIVLRRSIPGRLAGRLADRLVRMRGDVADLRDMDPPSPPVVFRRAPPREALSGSHVRSVAPVQKMRSPLSFYSACDAHTKYLRRPRTGFNRLLLSRFSWV